MPTKLKLSDIKIDGGTQPRCQINTDTVSEYAEAIKAGVTKLLGAIDSQDFAEASALLSAMQDAAWSIRDTLGIVKLSKSADGVVVGSAVVLAIEAAAAAGEDPVGAAAALVRRLAAATGR